MLRSRLRLLLTPELYMSNTDVLPTAPAQAVTDRPASLGTGLSWLPIATRVLFFTGKDPASDVPVRDRDEAPATDPVRGFGTFDTLVDTIAADGHGVVMTMGKGGVGKTTVAASLARALARRGLRVHLSTTDPASRGTGGACDSQLVRRPARHARVTRPPRSGRRG